MPADQAPETGDCIKTDPVWHVIHSRPRCEKKAEAWFHREGIECFLPLRESLRIYPSKKVLFHIPVFPGYLFAKFSPVRKRGVYASEQVANVLDVFDQDSLLREMENIRILLRESDKIQEHPFLAVGKRVRVASGKLKGLEGYVEKFHDKFRVVVSVEMFQQSVCMEVDPRLLREADD